MRLGIPYSKCPYESELPCTSEEEAIGIAVGVWLGGGEAKCFMQNSGFGRCIDIITSLLLPYDIPIGLHINNRLDLHHEYMGALCPVICKGLKYLNESSMISQTSV